MSHMNKKLALVAFVSLQSALMLAPGQNPATFSPRVGYQRFAPNRTISDGQLLVSQAKDHAAHAQDVANEAADHANFMQVAANHVATVQKAAEEKHEKLANAISAVQEYINSPTPRNGTLKAGYAEYKKAASFIKASAHDDIEHALGKLAEAYAALDALPKLTVEDRTVEAELHIAMNALRAIIEKKLV